MKLYDIWCDCEKECDLHKYYLAYTEKKDIRPAIMLHLGETVRSHYDDLEHIAEDIQACGLAKTAAAFKEILPETLEARAGELGEILAAEFVEENIGMSIPVKRLRYKDGREMALRGDDIIAVAYDETEKKLHLLKGESKNYENLSKSKAIDPARIALNQNDGRCSPTSLKFIADILIEKKNPLGRILRNERINQELPHHQISHLLFTISGNYPKTIRPRADTLETILKNNLKDADNRHPQYVVNLHLPDRRDFIHQTYEEAKNIGNP